MKELISDSTSINETRAICEIYSISTINTPEVRSSHRSCSLRKGVLRNFVKFAGKHLRQGLILIKLDCNFIKKETLAQLFSSDFCEISRNTFFTEYLWATASKKYPNKHLLNLFKVNNTNTQKRCERCWKLAINIPQRRQRPKCPYSYIFPTIFCCF